MTRNKRPNRTGQLYIKHGNYYGRWVAADGGRTNRKLSPVRKPGSAHGLTRGQAEQRLRELMSAVEVITDVERTMLVLGNAHLMQLEAKGRSRSHLQGPGLRTAANRAHDSYLLDRLDPQHV